MLPKPVSKSMLLFRLLLDTFKFILTEREKFKFSSKNPQTDMANGCCPTCRAQS